MTENALAIMRRIFLDRYDDIKARLTKRLGSVDHASDAMQDTWLRLEHAVRVGPVQSPDNYLYRIALNVAQDQRRVERRQRISPIEIESLLVLADDAPTPEQTVLGRSDLKAFKAIIEELPERRREIFMAARIGHMSHQEIADCLGISRQLATKEINLALRHCLVRMKELKD